MKVHKEVEAGRASFSPVTRISTRSYPPYSPYRPPW